MDAWRLDLEARGGSLLAWSLCESWGALHDRKKWIHALRGIMIEKLRKMGEKRGKAEGDRKEKRYEAARRALGNERATLANEEGGRGGDAGDGREAHLVVWCQASLTPFPKHQHPRHTRSGRRLGLCNAGRHSHPVQTSATAGLHVSLIVSKHRFVDIALVCRLSQSEQSDTLNQ